MENIDDKYKAELNFVDEFNLIRNGMIKEIDTIYQPMLNRILVMPLRKLLYESNSVLLNVCPDFKMPPLAGFPITLEDSQVLVRPPYEIKGNRSVDFG